MRRLSRRTFLTGAGAALGAAGALRGAPFVHAQKRGGTIRIIPIADLKVLDPIWTTAYVTRDHAYLVYDTLFASDASLADQAADGRQVQRQPRPDEVVVHAPRRPQVPRRPARHRRGLRGVAAALGPEGLARQAAAGRHGQAGRVGQEDVHAGPEGALRRGAGCARQAVEQRAVHHARPPGHHRRQRADQGGHRLGAVQVRQGRVAAGQPGGVRALRRLRPAQRGAERRRRGQARQRRPRDRALHSRRRDGVRGAGGGRGGLVGQPARRLLDAAREEPERHRVREESRRDPGLGAAQPPVPAVQQQEGASGASPHGRSGDVPAGGGRQREVLPHVSRATTCAACRRRRRPARRASPTSTAPGSS